mgnify:CR=1 FL=1|jgi:hypothetical protein|tara:strand:- start:376 stop:1230 length:855 start_codon:yes stop_codon:yes gene_type:complete
MNTNFIFPHPVLGNSTDFDPNNFTINVRKRLIDRNFEFRILFDIGSLHEDYEVLVAEGQFNFCISINCRRLYLREYYYSKSKTIEFTIPQGSLKGTVEFTGYIVAKSKIEKYAPFYQNEDFFFDAEYDLYPGDIVGISNTLKEFFDPDFQGHDRRKKRSIIAVEIDPNSKKSYYTVLDWGYDQLIVGIPKKLHEKWQPLSKSEYEIFNKWVLIFPVLTEAIEKVTNQDSDLADTKWYEVIQNSLIEKDLWESDLDYSTMAQILMEGPLQDYIVKLNYIDELSKV